MLTGQIASLAGDFGAEVDHLGLVVNEYDPRRGYVVTSWLELWQQDPRVIEVLPDRNSGRRCEEASTPGVRADQ